MNSSVRIHRTMIRVSVSLSLALTAPSNPVSGATVRPSIWAVWEKRKDGVGKQELTVPLTDQSTDSRNSASSRAVMLALLEYDRDHISNESHSCSQICATRRPPSPAPNVESPGTSGCRVESDSDYAQLELLSQSCQYFQKKCLRNAGVP